MGQEPANNEHSCNEISFTISQFHDRLLSIQVSIYKTIGCRYELSLCFVLCLSFMFAFVIFLNIFHISGSLWH